jgi:hypothetical protein
VIQNSSLALLPWSLLIEFFIKNDTASSFGCLGSSSGLFLLNTEEKIERQCEKTSGGGEGDGMMVYQKRQFE